MDKLSFQNQYINKKENKNVIECLYFTKSVIMDFKNFNRDLLYLKLG